MREPKLKKPLFFAVGLGFSTHQRLMQIGDHVRADMALAVWICVLDYTRSKELDGHCPRAVVDQPHREKAIADLLRVGLITAYEKNGAHWLYLENYELLNETKAQIEARLRQQRGWKRSSRKRQADVRPDSGLTPAGVHASQSQSQTDLKNPPVCPPGGTQPSSSVAVAKGTRKTPKPGTQVPADGDPDAMAAWCLRWEIPHDHPKLNRMLDWARAKGVVRKDWKAQWRNWLNSPFADTETARQGVFRSRDGGSSQEDPYEVQQRVKRRDRLDLMAEVRERLGLVQGGKQ